MEENLRFIYGREYWYISAFINTVEFVGESKAEEIEKLLLDKLHNLTEKDFSKAFRFLDNYPKAEEKKELLRDMANSISIECDWEPFFQNFPYIDENKPFVEKDGKEVELKYNTLGYFKLIVEYYQNEESKKEEITPDLIQQIPFIAVDILREFSKRKENEFLLLDLDSPIYVFLISNKTNSTSPIEWNRNNREKYKKVLGYWTRIYSGQWADYSDELFERRIEDNFSNRLSELHYLQRNSGFIYMVKENYLTQFDYILTHVLEPTQRVRAVLFALMTINNSLDILFMKRYSQVFMSLETIEKKIDDLRYLRGIIQTKMSMIYSELDWNPREHYTRVLVHLIRIFRIDRVIKRVDKKFKLLYDAMQEYYQQRNIKNQKATRTILYLVNIILSAGIVKDFFDVLVSGTTNYVYFIATTILGLMFIGTISFIILHRLKAKVEEKGYTADAVILVDKQKVILIRRKYWPFAGKYALPGGFIKHNEDAEQAIIREVREETHLSVEVVKKIGTYDKEGRDPRGRIISTAFKCRVKDLSKMAEGDDAALVEAIPIEKIKKMDLAFDHKQILKDAGVL